MRERGGGKSKRENEKESERFVKQLKLSYPRAKDLYEASQEMLEGVAGKLIEIRTQGNLILPLILTAKENGKF